MSIPGLPDDPKDWPDDPFVVLGVRPGADDTDLKRAYTRLIRRFKPEHFPEQFRLIREAYEACQLRSRWFRPDPEPDVAPAPPPEPLPRPQPVADPIDNLWDLAAAGREAEGYTGLAEQARLSPDRADLPLRLYWLLALAPALDADRSRHDWLADALARSRLRGAAAELYRRELDASPHDALGGPYGGVLTAPATRADRMTLARWRVAAAGRAGLYSRIKADLDALRPHFAGHDDEGWLGLLVAVKDWTAWTALGGVDDFIRGDLADLRHLELRHATYFDRMEESDQHAADMRWADTQFPRELMAVIKVARAAHGDVRPEAVEAAAAVVAARPEEMLRTFDLVLSERGSGLLLLAATTLERYRYEHGGAGEPPFPPELIRGLARRLAPGPWLPTYSWVRSGVLKLLRSEALAPLELADACAEDPEPQYRTLAEHVRGDLSLRLVWLAGQIHPPAAG